ncbi:Long-chain-fatty-acid--CoA ligase [Caenispirillum salinarum AK4]|uniref:Long-chain-fatty-acid--CoA ligase n=1 Tax=Caenispirillum salinarum AK4 TaxID=1238182 RepID=K9HUE3_9PROT|nr:AMP-binding protein [Caenispirillum salinarum]EKV31871.1 Long-chain-fatty-acid--CoA ligase [Caenispirillum salinarum AK4]
MDISTIFDQAVERYPDHIALVYEGRRWTYAEWHARVSRFAQALANLGVRQGDRVAFYVSTSEASVTTYFATQMLSAIAVPMNFRLAPAEVDYILRDSGARVLVYGRALTDNALAVASGLNSCHDWISCADDPAEVPEGHHHFEALAEQTQADGAPRVPPPADALSALVYTSGTTGRPKGVMHSHANDVAIAMNCIMEYRLSHRDTALHIAPLYHVGGMQAYFIPHMMVGGTNVVMGRYDTLKTLETIQAEGITTLFAVPTQIQDILFHPRFRDFNVSSLRMITTGGAAIAASTMERVITELCPEIYNGYGMTEASLTLLLHPQDALARLGSCGRPTLISSCRIIRNEPGAGPDAIVPPGETGQLIVRGPQAMSGYWNKPAETAKKVRDGWIFTGDLFVKDDDGFHYFKGRADDMIVSGGENIYPREVEEALYRCPGVQEAAVVGLPDARWGQQVTAFVVPAGGMAEDEVAAWIKSSGLIAGYKAPKKVIFLDVLPTNPSGKVVKHELLAKYGKSEAA